RGRAVERRRDRGRANVAERARASLVAGTARCAGEREQADRAIRRRPLVDDGGAATDVQAAAGEVLDEGAGVVQRVATGAAGSAGGELEERPADLSRRRGRGGRGRGGGGAAGGGGGGGRGGHRTLRWWPDRPAAPAH